MARLTGRVSVDEAVSEITKLAVQHALEYAVNGYLDVRIECDGSYYFEQPMEKQ